MTIRSSAGIVIGGGVAGLAFAAALQNQGHPVTILESAASLRAAGSGLVLGPTALRALRMIGLAGEVISAGQILASGRLVDLSLRPLSHDAFGYYAQKTSEHFVGIERGTLVRLLASAAPPCRTNAHYTHVRENGDGVIVTLASGETLVAPWLVLADGIRSKARASFTSSVIRDAGQWCWRGIADGVDTGRFRDAFVEACGSEWRFGLSPVGGGKTYWFITRRDPRNAHGPIAAGASRKQYVGDAAAALSPLLYRLVIATPGDLILENRLEDLAPLARWHSPHMICIGDAAHAMTPNLGQGATQALEDGIILAASLARAPSNLASVFAQFEAMRRRRTERTVREARMLGALAHAPRAFTAIRNTALRSLPRRFSLKQLAWLYEDEQLIAALS